MKKDEAKYFKEIKSFENKYYDIVSHFETNFPTPLNLQQEKLKFFKALADDKIYNPQIIFKRKNFDLKRFEQLKRLKIDIKNDMYGFKKLYKQRLKTKIAEILCHVNWGDPISTKYVKIYRGAPSRFLLSRAKVYCKKYKREVVKFTQIEPKEMGLGLKLEVLALTGNNIKIKYEDIASNVNINPTQNLIIINPNMRHTTLDLKRLKIHEIGVHYMRYYNGDKTGLKILRSGTSNYIETEEGLAVYAEEKKGVASKAQMFIYAGRVIATYYALRLSFYDVYKMLKEYGFKREDAFAITYRAKRNLSDTSKPGGFTKDYVYFSGYLKIKRYVRFHNINNLFIGKIKLEDLKPLKKYIKKNKGLIKTIFQ